MVLVSPSRSSRIAIVGSGASGAALALMLRDIDAEVVLLEQVIPPGRKHGFNGLLRPVECIRLGIASELLAGLPISRVVHLDLPGGSILQSVATPGMISVSHNRLLGRLIDMAVAGGVTWQPDATVTDFTWNSGEISGVRLESGASIAADLVVLADESDPRLAEQLGLRPDWMPTELMHLARLRFQAEPGQIAERFDDGGAGTQVVVFQHRASWGTAGYGLLIPGPDSISLVVAISLEDEMVTSKHISEYLDEVQTFPALRQTLDGLESSDFFTEVVPTGGFDAARPFHTDHFLVANDLVGVTNPLNRDGYSTNLGVCQAAATTIREAVAAGSFTSRELASYSRRIAEGVLSPVHEARRTDRSVREQPAWQWAAFPELGGDQRGVTATPKSATLSGIGNSKVWKTLRRFGREAGTYRHRPGEFDE